jgi:large subunit ribosomal protein L5
MRLKELYKKEIMLKMKEQFGYKNINSTPKVEKVVVNVGFGRQTKEKEALENIQKSLLRITGQKPLLTKAKKSISAFKLREGTVIGAKVTLRGQRMFDFLEKLVNITFPRVRDFRGLDDKNMDNRGNLTVGVKEHLAFPEIKQEEIDNAQGLEICIATTAQTKQEGLELLKLIGFPFKVEDKNNKS